MTAKSERETAARRVLWTVAVVWAFVPAFASAQPEIPTPPFQSPGAVRPADSTATSDSPIGTPELVAPSLPAASAPLGPRAPLAEVLQQRGDLTLRNAPMESALFTIREIWNVNIVAGKNVGGTINCVFHDTPLKEVLDAILMANGYSYRAVGESLVVQEIKSLGSGNPLLRSVTIPVERGDLSEYMEAARLLSSADGQIRALPSARSMLVVDYEDRVQQIEEFVKRLEKSAQPIPFAGQLAPGTPR
ncbi:MAG: hypothetical protein KDA61_22470, partial [Planctomycetales bacterium]|nr:hypothetical protein [Planctomycetales bacterium]